MNRRDILRVIGLSVIPVSVSMDAKADIDEVDASNEKPVTSESSAKFSPSLDGFRIQQNGWFLDNDD